MRTIAVLLFLVVASLASPIVLFKDFMLQNDKKYSTSEFDHRFSIFKDNLMRMQELNTQHKHAKFGITKYADLTPEEFKAIYLSSKPFVNDPTWPVDALFPEDVLASMPDSWDWRNRSAVTEVKNQGDCGSCWSFSTTGNIEGQWAIAGNKLVGLSEQNLVDCDHHCMTYEGQQVCDAGCDGGLMPNAFMYVMSQGGIDTEAAYPYMGVDGTCQQSNTTFGAKIRSWTMISNNETQMAAWLWKNGPISIAVDAEAWQFYIGGVFQDPWCGTTLDHGVLLVGYGHELNWLGEYTEFWIVKNSWGADWGESGYIRIERGDGECGDTIFPCSSLV